MLTEEEEQREEGGLVAAAAAAVVVMKKKSKKGETPYCKSCLPRLQQGMKWRRGGCMMRCLTSCGETCWTKGSWGLVMVEEEEEGGKDRRKQRRRHG